MRRKQHERRNWFARGPEIIPEAGTWQYKEYKKGRHFYEPVLPGQCFPKEASLKELDRLARIRGDQLASLAAEQAVRHVASMEQPAQEPGIEMPETSETLAA